jgi:hypothetical protein
MRETRFAAFVMCVRRVLITCSFDAASVGGFGISLCLHVWFWIPV